ncbi:sterile alpha motif domain-containing protein 9-like [Saccoglossus kowalevskii]
MEGKFYSVFKPSIYSPEFRGWCRERLQERCGFIRQHRNLQIVNKVKQPKKKVRYRYVKYKPYDKLEARVPAKPDTVQRCRNVVCDGKYLHDSHLQVFLYSDLSFPLVVKAKCTETVSSIKAQFLEHYNCSSLTFDLTTNKGFLLCDKLTLEDHGIVNDTNLYVKITGSELKGGGDTPASQDKKTVAPTTHEHDVFNWKREDVRQWLHETVELHSKYVDRMYNEEVDGETLLLYKEDDLKTDFKMKEDDQNHELQLPPHLENWNVDHVKQWLNWKKFKENCIDALWEEEVDGKILSSFLVVPFEKLAKKFHLRKGSLRKLIHHVELLQKITDVQQHNKGIAKVVKTTKIEKSESQTSTLNKKEKILAQINSKHMKVKKHAGQSKTPQQQTLDEKRASGVQKNDHDNDKDAGSKMNEKSEYLANKNYVTCIKTINRKHPSDTRCIAPGNVKIEDTLNNPHDNHQHASTHRKTEKSRPSYADENIEELKNRLKLKAVDTYKSRFLSSTLQLISGKFGKKENQLEQQFSFFVLTKATVQLTEHESKKLWEQIQKNVRRFVCMLPPKFKDIFDCAFVCQELGTVQRVEDKQKLTLRSTDLCVCSPLQKSWHNLSKHTMFFLLVDSQLLTDELVHYETYLDDEKKQQIFFQFDSKHAYTAYFDVSNEDLELKFKEENELYALNSKQLKEDPMQHEVMSREDDCDNVTRDKSTVTSIQLSNNHGVKDEQLNTSLANIPKHSATEQESEVLSVGKHTEYQLGRTFSKMGSTGENTETATRAYDKIDMLQLKQLRLFNREVENFSYTKNKVIDAIETGVKNLTQVVHEFKQFTSYIRKDDKERKWKFVWETLRFAAACLNDRTNGTIHFGIADNKSNHYQHGQILGVEVKDKAEYGDELDYYICKCFKDTEYKNSARLCIRPPQYVPVFDKGNLEQCYVVEVDIVPNIAHTKGKAFFIKLPKDPQYWNSKKVTFDKSALYRRLGSATCKQEEQDVHDYLQKSLPNLDKEREERELQDAEYSMPIKRSDLAHKLIWLLCTGGSTLDTSFFPILVVNKPKSYDLSKSEMRFIKMIDWVAVFDFDAESQKLGIFREYAEQKIPNIHDPDMYLNITDVCYHRDQISFPEKTCWIFANGRTDIDHLPYGRLKWNMKRRKGVKEAVRFFADENVIPKDRSIVVFLLLNEDIDGMVNTFSEFSAYFALNRIMCVAREESIFRSWVAEIGGITCPVDLLNERSVVGMPWDHVNATVQQIMGIRNNEMSYIPSSTGAFIALSERDRNSYTDFDILSRNECNPDVMSAEELNVFLRKKELQFYQGHLVNWWNFWATDNGHNHVLRRDKHLELKRRVNQVLQPISRSGTEEKVKLVSLFHQPGAGGSTMARNVLWELRDQFRCVVIKRVTHDTANQLFKLWSFKEDKNMNRIPVVAVGEELDEATLRELRIQIEGVCTRKAVRGHKPLCLMIHCKRFLLDHHGDTTQRPPESISLEQYLSKDERRWFVNKLAQLNEKAHEFEEINPRHLISFMILKENFNQEYVENVVSGILEKIPKYNAETLLLKYIALLNSYVSKSSVVVSCCDSLMGIGSAKLEKQRNQYIEFLLSPSAKLLLLEMQNVELGSVKAFKIVHSLVASTILKQLQLRENQRLGQVAIEFLKSKLFQTSSYGKEQLSTMTSEMLKKRKKHEYGDDYETKFSPLIMDILKCSNKADGDHDDDATNTLLEGMKLFPDDAMIIQQVARIYLYRKKFEKAKTFAEKAVEMKRDNSYLLDTLGEVYKEQMNNEYQVVKVKQSVITPEEALNALKLAFKAMSVFRESQQASTREKHSQNTAGYIKEVETCFRLIEILLCVNKFKKEPAPYRELHKYLVDDDYIPTSVSMVWAEYHRHMKALIRNVDQAMKWMNDYCTYHKDEYFHDNSALQKLKNKMYNFNSSYTTYFGEQFDEHPPEITDPESVCEWNRRRVASYGCGHFRNIFSLVQDYFLEKNESDKQKDIIRKLKDSKKLLNLNSPRNTFDLHNLIFIHFALSIVDKREPAANEKYLYDLNFLYIQQSGNDNLYPYFVQSMLMWPRENIGQIVYDEQTLTHCLAQLKKLYPVQRKNEFNIKHKQISITPSRIKPATFFFLGKGQGLRAFIHITELNVTSRSNFENRDRFWESERVRNCLKRVKGILWSTNSIYAYDGLKGNKATIDILPSIPLDNVTSRDTVSFYVGFSWSGPVAYNITTQDEEHYDEEMHTTMQTADKGEVPHENDAKGKFSYIDYRRKHRRLKQKLNEINNLKKKKDSGEGLQKKQIEKIAMEETFQNELHQLEKEYEDELTSDPDFFHDYY